MRAPRRLGEIPSLGRRAANRGGKWTMAPPPSPVSAPGIPAAFRWPRGFRETSRRDAWWAQPLTVFVVLSSFIVYSTWAALQNRDYHFGSYLSPFYSPEIFGDSPHSWLGPKPAWWPALL